MKDEVAGDPVSGCKWSRKSTYTIAEQINRLNIQVSPSTVSRLLKAQKFSLRKNRKNIESASSKATDPQIRDQQFGYIRRQRREFERKELPVISIDTKARQLIGRFCQGGRRWGREPEACGPFRGHRRVYTGCPWRPGRSTGPRVSG